MLAAGEEVRDIDIKLVRGGVITGRVTDAENNPIVEERVNLSSIREGPRISPAANSYRPDVHN
jgi:hypothetical protein